MIGVVPLSEEEQRILRQIEQELEQDPTFSQRGYRVSRRRSSCSPSGLVLGLVITIGGLAVSFVVAFAGFVLVLVMAIMLESEAPPARARTTRSAADLGVAQRSSTRRRRRRHPLSRRTEPAHRVQRPRR